MMVNLVGAVATGIVMLTLAVTKFTDGAWIVIVIIPVLVATFLAMHGHYDPAKTARLEERWGQWGSACRWSC
jgi:hypothetical protein